MRELERRTFDIVSLALRSGFRHLDCAAAYGNEAAVGRAIAESGLPREELFITSKCSNFLPGASPDLVEVAFQGQLKALGVDYLDLYLLHAPAPTNEETMAYWRQLEALCETGKARAIGVCNFGASQLEELLRAARVRPVCLQNKLSVYWPGEQSGLFGEVSLPEVCQRNGVQFVGYSCVNAWPALLPPTRDPHVVKLAARHHCTPAQLLARWALQLGASVLVRSQSQEHMEENLAALQVPELSDEAMQLLSGLAQLQHSRPPSDGGLFPAFIDGNVYSLRVA